MARRKNYFDIGVSILILIVLLSNTLVIYALETYFGPLNYWGIFLIFLVDSVFVLALIELAYKAPIDELNQVINEFMTWWVKGKDIKVNNNFKNPNVKFIINFFDYILNSLKNIKSEFISGKAIKWEVQLATELQEKLLHKKLEPIPSIDIVAKSKPAGEIWWDSYDIIKEGNNYYIYVGDATGHGVGAGFVMVMVNALVSGFSKIFRSGAQILWHTNEILKPRIKSNILMTLLMVRWDEEQKRLFMTGAGHEYLIIYKHKLQKAFMIKSWGMALGMTKNIHKILKEQEIKFEENDLLVLYTDGITEAINQNKKDGNEQMFGEQRILDAIASSPVLPWTAIKTAASVFKTITIELSRFMGYQHVQLDDITLVVAHYKGTQNFENESSEIKEEFITEWNWNK